MSHRIELSTVCDISFQWNEVAVIRSVIVLSHIKHYSSLLWMVLCWFNYKFWLFTKRWKNNFILLVPIGIEFSVYSPNSAQWWASKFERRPLDIDNCLTTTNCTKWWNTLAQLSMQAKRHRAHSNRGTREKTLVHNNHNCVVSLKRFKIENFFTLP